MPNVRAVFSADISSFRQSLAQASTAVTAFDRTVGQVNTDLKKFGNEFSGATLIRRAETMAKAIGDIGGASRLTDSELKHVNATVTEALQKYARLGQEAPASVKALSNELRGLTSAGEKATTAVGGGLTAIIAGAAGGAAVLALSTITSGLRDVVAAGVKLTPLEQSFERLKGGAGNAEEALRALRRETLGLASDSDLIQASNKASLLGLDAMGIKFEEVAGVATRLGRAMGQDAAKSVDDLTTALARQSTPILDNLGIKLNLTEATTAYAQKIGKSVEALTEEEKKLAFATVAMEAARAKAKELGDVQLTVWENVTRVLTALGDLGAMLVSAGNESVTLAGQLGKVADALDRIRNAPGDFRNTIARTLSDAGRWATDTAERVEREAPWYLSALASVGMAPTALAGFTARSVAPLIGNPSPFTPDLFRPMSSHTGGAPAAAPGPVGPTKEQLDAIKKWREEIERITGLETIRNAERLAKQLQQVGLGAVPKASIVGFVDDLQAAAKAARETGRAIALDITNSIEALVRTPAYREAFQRGLTNPTIGLGERSSLSAITGTALDPILNPFASNGPLIPSGKPLSGQIWWLQSAVTDMPRVVTQTRDWRMELERVSSAFSRLSQIAGPAFDGVSRTLGTLVASASVGVEMTQALSKFIGGLTDDQGNQTKAGNALSGGFAGLTTGLQLGGLIPQSRWGAVAAGLGGGALSGGLATGWNPVGIGVGAVVGGIGAALASGAQARALNKAKDVQAEQLVAQFGTLDNLLDVVGALGLNQQSFLERFYGDPQAFASGVSELNAALTNEQRVVDRLAKSLKAAADAQGILSREDMAALANLRAGGPGGEVATQFLQGQTSQLVAGLTQAAQSGVLSAAGQQGVGLGLGAAFASMREQGVSVVAALRQLEPAIKALTDAGGGASVAGLQSLIDLMNDAELGPFVDAAYGASAAIAALANTGLITQEMFDGLGASITDAYKALVADGRGEDALRLLQGPLQNLWQMMTDFGLTVDEGTQALIDMAADAGIVGDKFRPATDRMVSALDRFIERMDVLLGQFAALSGVTWPQPPNGAGIGPGDEPPMDTPGAPHPGGGDYTPFAVGGLVTRPTRALIGEAGPEAVIPLHRLRSIGRSITIVTVATLDGREVARAVNRYQGDERRAIGVA